MGEEKEPPQSSPARLVCPSLPRQDSMFPPVWNVRVSPNSGRDCRVCRQNRPSHQLRVASSCHLYVLREPADTLAVALAHDDGAHEDLDRADALERDLALTSCCEYTSAHRILNLYPYNYLWQSYWSGKGRAHA